MQKPTTVSAKKRKSMITKLEKVSMPLRMKRVFQSKYGLVDGTYKTNAEVARRYKMTGEAVRLILIKVHALIDE